MRRLSSKSFQQKIKLEVQREIVKNIFQEALFFKELDQENSKLIKVKSKQDFWRHNTTDAISHIKNWITWCSCSRAQQEEAEKKAYKRRFDWVFFDYSDNRIN